MNIYYIFRTMLAQKGANAIKIVSVAVGLLVSCIIFNYLAYQYSYDTCYRDYKRLYVVETTYEFGGKEQGPLLTGNGVLAGAITEELPDDVIASSGVELFEVTLADGERTKEVEIIAGDSVLFETLGLEVINGYPRKDLTTPGVVYLSESTAREFFGDEDPIGKTLKFDYAGMTETTLTVRGVFKDMPENVTQGPYDAVFSFPTLRALEIDERMAWDNIGGSNVYIRVLPCSKIRQEVIDSKLNELQQRNHPAGENSFTVTFSTVRVDKIKSSNPENRTTNMIMWMLGISLLLITTLNYSLITIASLSRRAKAIGVHKCSGASSKNIITMFLGETLCVIVLAMVIMTVLFLLFQPFIEEMFRLSVSQLLSPHILWASAAVLLFFFFVGGLIPGFLFSKIPVTQVFRRFTDKNSAWKKNLLFIQMTGVAFVGGLLVTFSAQYHEVMNRDMGYDMSNLVMMNDYQGVLGSRDVAVKAFASLPYVEDWCEYGSGSQNIFENGKRTISCDVIRYSRNFLDMAHFQLLNGRYPKNSNEILVNEKFCEAMNYGDNVIGRTVGDDGLVISGIVRDFNHHGFTAEIEPTILCPFEKDKYGVWLVKLKAPFDRNYEEFMSYLSDTFPKVDFVPRNMNELRKRQYAELNAARNSSAAAVVALIFIALMGLTGFVRDEVERRRKEIAIRKVNGATITDIIRIISADLLKITVPAVVIGTIVAWYVGSMMIEDFTVESELIPLYLILTAIAILALVLLCVYVITVRIANENPVNQLKSE